MGTSLLLASQVLVLYYVGASADKVMEIHSFNNQIEHPTFLSRWWNAGASIPLENHIVLTPSVPDRFGAQWHKYPLLTNDFEVTFTVVVKPVAGGVQPPNDQGFAFWYVYENVTQAMGEDLTRKASEVTTHLAANGWGLFGYRNQFKGLGVIFSNNKKGASEGVTEFKPSISIIVNDGTRKVELPGDIPSPFGSYWNYRNGNLHIKLRVQKSGILLEGKQDTNKDWIKLGEIKADKLPMSITSGGYIGFTGMIGADKVGSPKTKFGQHDTVLIDNVVLRNMDVSQKGEEVLENAQAASASIKHSEFLHDHSDKGVERAEGHAIKKLSQMIFKFISETEPQKKAMMSAISTLSAKLVVMERSVKKLKEEIVALSGHDMDADYEKMKQELAALSSKAISDAATKNKQFQSLKSEIETSIDSKSTAKRASTAQVIKAFHEVDQKARELKTQVASRGSYLMYVALFCLVLVVAAGLALQAKLKRWEKKHLL
jgi:hypothetical protein